MERMGARADLIDEVVALILATQHRNPPNNDREQLLVDIDLAILGAPAAQYDRYEQSIRLEYRAVPGPIYRRERKKILSSFLDRPAVYGTPGIHRELETPARANLRRAIAQL